MLSDAYASAMSRKETNDVVAAESPGWQLQFVGPKKGRGVVFKIVDVRDAKERLVDPMAPLRRVWEVNFNINTGYAGKMFLTLRDFYPEIADWATLEMFSYCEKEGVEGGKRGRKKKVALLRNIGANEGGGDE